MLHIHIYIPSPSLPRHSVAPLEPMKRAGSAAAATAEAAIRTHCLSQAQFGQQQDTAIIVAHEAIGLGATLPPRGPQRRVQCATIATLAAQPNPRWELLLLLAPNGAVEQQAKQAE